MSTSSIAHTGRELIVAIRREQLSFLAAAVAYYAFVSVVPLTLVGIAVATAVGGDALADQLVTALRGTLTPEAADVLVSALTSSSGRGSATIVGLLVLTWSALRLFRGLDVAFGRVYGRETNPSLIDQVRDGVVTLVAIGVGVIVTVLLAGALPLFRLPLAGVLGSLALTAALSVIFMPVYYVLPDRELEWREVIPGAVVAGGGWTILGTAFSVYASYAGSFQVYGVLGGVLLLLTWLYVGGLVILFGAVLNATLAARRRDRQLQQGSPRAWEQRGTMSEGDGPGEGTDDAAATPDVEPLDVETADPEEIERLRREIARFEDEIEDRTVHRDELESDLKRYVRRRVRRGHARGWGPYLVLLYGTAMTVGAFYFLDGGWAILAMLVIWLSTLGLYVLMVLVGMTITAVGIPSRLLDRVRDLR